MYKNYINVNAALRNTINDYYKEYLMCIKQNIIMAVLRKAKSHSVDICRLLKNQ